MRQHEWYTALGWTVHDLGVGATPSLRTSERSAMAQGHLLPRENLDLTPGGALRVLRVSRSPGHP
jgi:hypothetical protein